MLGGEKRSQEKAQWAKDPNTSGDERCCVLFGLTNAPVVGTGEMLKLLRTWTQTSRMNHPY